MTTDAIQGSELGQGARHNGNHLSDLAPSQLRIQRKTAMKLLSLVATAVCLIALSTATTDTSSAQAVPAPPATPAPTTWEGTDDATKQIKKNTNSAGGANITCDFTGAGSGSDKQFKIKHMRTVGGVATEIDCKEISPGTPTTGPMTLEPGDWVEADDTPADTNNQKPKGSYTQS